MAQVLAFGALSVQRWPTSIGPSRLRPPTLSQEDQCAAPVQRRLRFREGDIPSPKAHAAGCCLYPQPSVGESVKSPPRFRAWLALVIAATAAFVAVWIVVPAPSYELLIFGVAAPEVSAWLLAMATLAGGLALIDVHRRRVARIAVSFSVVTLVLALLPLLRFPFTARRFGAAMHTALGADFLRDVPPEIRGAMRPRPLVAVDLFRGVDAGEARVTRGILFAAPGGVPLTLDVYRPLSGGPFPVIVQIYGGAWQRGVPGANADFARYCAAHGYVVFAIDYRHAPRWRWPAQLADVRAALAWIHSHAAEYHADAARLALIGRSAGAHLAMLAAYAPGAPPVRAVVSYYGPVDLIEGYRQPPRPDPLRVRRIEEAFLGGTPDQLPVRYRDASPITHVVQPLPPTLLVYGGRDHVVEPRFGAKLHERLRATGTTSVLLVIPWAEHAFDAVSNGPSAQLTLYHTERFLAWALWQRPRAAAVPGP